MTTELTETPDIESSSRAYAKRFSGSVGAYFLDVQQNAVDRLIGPCSGLSVLDVGGGHAQLAPSLIRRGACVTVVGSDLDGRLQLDEKVGAQAYQYDVGNLLALPYDDDAFDVVIAIRLLPHLDNWEVFIGELCRVARSSVIVDYPSVRSANYFADKLFGAKKAIETDTRPYKCFGTAELTTPFEQRGYLSAGTVRQFAIPMALHRALGSRVVSSLSERAMGLVAVRQLFGSPVIHKFENSATPGAAPTSANSGGNVQAAASISAVAGEARGTGGDAHTAKLAVVDAHAHLHSCFNTDQALLEALNNMRSVVARSGGAPDDWIAYLMVSQLDDTLPNVAADRVKSVVSSFDAQDNLEAGSLSLSAKASGERLNVIFGNQLVTEEGLEVLVYGHQSPLPNRATLMATLEAAKAQDALIILPWGFGKWLGKRGRVLGAAFAEISENRALAGNCHVGDSGVRLAHSPLPTLLTTARTMGYRNLPGSDPLPFDSDYRKLGGFGFTLQLTDISAEPLRQFRKALDSSATQPTTYGAGESLAAFVRKQWLMQARKHIPGWA